MFGLGQEFLEHTKQWQVEPALVGKIMGDSLDIERLIEAVDAICTARSPLEHIISDEIASLDAVDKVRAEVEWYVQHAAERVIASKAHLMWGPVLRTSEAVELTFVTTNYDRAIELAANAEGLRLNDGFDDFAEGETAFWLGFDDHTEEMLLVKLHGSTDWYSESNTGRPRKLRHPMPLFGRAELRLPEGRTLGSALILPSREKRLNRSPYPRLSHTFIQEIDRCDVLLVVGSSMRDDHLRGAAETAAQRVPVYVVNPDGSTFDLDHAVALRQPASRFLMSTLPNAFLTSDPLDYLSTIDHEADSEDRNVLHAMGTALDGGVPAHARCEAIDDLLDIGAVPDPTLLDQLLGSPNPTVARYALGLIPLSPEKENLLGTVANGDHVEDAAFSEDLSLLRGLLEA